MATELVYTSAPAGLKPGTYGFCVVACTRGLKESYTTALLPLSGYRRVFSAESGRGAQNPVVYANYIVEVGGIPKRVLSRVADAGYDYSNRTNKIACHLILSNHELTKSGPAALFAVPNLFVESWNSKPGYFEQEKQISTPPETPLNGAYWKALTGDSKWARALAATLSTGRSVLLVVRPDCDVLRLYREAIELLPPAQRWNATFSTYFTTLPPGVQCQWKAVIAGSPEEEKLRSGRDTFIIDLSAPGRLGSLENFVASIPTWNSWNQRPKETEPLRAPVVPSAGAALVSAPAVNRTPEPQHVYNLHAEDVLTPVPVAVKPIRKTLNYGRDAVLKTDVPLKKRNNIAAIAIISAVVILSVALIGGGVWGVVRYPKYTKQVADNSPVDNPAATNATQNENGNSSPDADDAKPKEDKPKPNEEASPAKAEDAKNEAPEEVRTPEESEPEALTSDDRADLMAEASNENDPAEDVSDPVEQEKWDEVVSNPPNPAGAVPGQVVKSKEEFAEESDKPVAESKHNVALDESVDESVDEENRSGQELVGLQDSFKPLSDNWESKDNKVIQKISYGADESVTEGVITGDYQENLKNLVEICRKSNNYKISIYVNILGGSLFEFAGNPNHQFEEHKDFEFAQNETSENKSVSFKVQQKDVKKRKPEESQEVTFKINDDGSLSINFPDKQTYTDFLGYGQIKWGIKDIGETKYIALLQPDEKSWKGIEQQDEGESVKYEIDLHNIYKGNRKKHKLACPAQFNESETSIISDVRLMCEIHSNSYDLGFKKEARDEFIFDWEISGEHWEIKLSLNKKKEKLVVEFIPDSEELENMSKKDWDNHKKQIDETIRKDLSMELYLGSGKERGKWILLTTVKESNDQTGSK